jgi:glycerol kinase
LEYIAAIDQGTTSTRCLIFDHHGRVISISQKEHRQIFPFPGWVEHDPLEILANSQEVFKNAVNLLNFDQRCIKAVGITNQRETTVLWNKETGKPYSNSVVWQDIRTNKICDQLITEGFENVFRQKTGLPIATYFSGPKIKWLLENNKKVINEVSKDNILFGTMDTWLIWNLTGGIKGGKHVSDVTNASRTLLMNLRTLDWDEDLLNILGIPKNILPKILPSCSYFGDLKIEGKEIPITGDLGDQQAALFGQACFNPGDAKNTYGTGCFMLLNTGEKIVQSSHGLLTTIAYQIHNENPVYCLEGSIAVTGALIQWLRDNLGIIQNSKEVETLAATVPDNGGVYFVPAFSGLFAPYWKPNARGLIIGLTRFSNKGHIARAALEAAGYQTLDVLDSMIQDSGVRLDNLKVDGGMVANDSLMQFQADLLNLPIIRPNITETTALGAAYIAGLSTGFWKNLEDIKNNWNEERRWIPRMSVTERDHLYANWKKAVTRSFDWDQTSQLDEK